MPADDLLALRLPQDASAIASLDPVGSWDLESVSQDDLGRLLDHFRKLWLSLLSADDPYSEPLIVAGEDTTIELRDAAAFDRLFLRIGSYFDAAVTRAATSNDLALDYPLAFRVSDLDRMVAFDEPEDAALRATILSARVVTLNYVLVLIGSFFARAMAHTPRSHLHIVIEAQPHDLLVELHHHAMRSDGDRKVLLERLVHSLLHALQRAFAQDEREWSASHVPGPFSAIQLGELELLARRAPSVVRRYGAKHVEKAFENQLALIAQSFGFYVVQTRTGTRTVDLVCISDDPQRPLMFLLEAKTSTRAYALPTKDQRALREYIADVRNVLRALPALRFVLLLSHSVTRTVDGKLRRLEAETGVPVRLMKAEGLAALREALPGPIPVDIFAQRILEAPRIVPDDFGPALAAAEREVHRAHEQFVRTMMGSRIIGAVSPGGVATTADEDGND